MILLYVCNHEQTRLLSRSILVRCHGIYFNCLLLCRDQTIIRCNQYLGEVLLDISEEICIKRGELLYWFKHRGSQSFLSLKPNEKLGVYSNLKTVSHELQNILFTCKVGQLKKKLHMHFEFTGHCLFWFFCHYGKQQTENSFNKKQGHFQCWVP